MSPAAISNLFAISKLNAAHNSLSQTTSNISENTYANKLLKKSVIAANFVTTNNIVRDTIYTII